MRYLDAEASDRLKPGEPDSNRGQQSHVGDAADTGTRTAQAEARARFVVR